MCAVQDIPSILACYFRHCPAVAVEHVSADDMMSELGTELETLCLKFAMDTGWTEATGHQPRARALAGRKRKRKTAQQIFDTSSDEDEEGDAGASGSGGLGVIGAQLADSTRRVIKTHVLEYLQERHHQQDLGKRRVKDPLAYWSQNQGRWPVVAQVARHSLCVPAASATSERGFSKTGHIVRARRATLTDERVSQLSFLACNPDI